LTLARVMVMWALPLYHCVSNSIHIPLWRE